MRNGLLLLVVAGVTVANGLFLDRVPPWRQALFVVLPVAAYLLNRRLPTRRGWLILAAAAVPAVASWFWSVTTMVGAVAALALFVVLPWLAGGYQRQQAALVRAAAERVTQVEREVRLRERSRLASDLHDSLGHDLALIALRAGGLELAAGMTEANRAAATDLRESAVAATDRLRNTLHLLREGDAAPPSSVSALVESARSAGMAVTFTGADTTDPTIHRVVREALTNATRHAPSAPVTVTITGTTVTVQNPLPGTRAASPRPAPGMGLAGLRERVTLLGGTFEAGAAAGSFTVTARIPAGEPR